MKVKQLSADRILKKVVNYFNPDLQRIEEGRKRMEKIWEGKEIDYLPILLPGVKITERNEFPNYNLKEQFYDPVKMLVEHLWGIISSSRVNDDSQLTIRANLGTGFIPSAFGLKQKVFPDKMPWVVEKLSKEEIEKIDKKKFITGIKEKGLMPRALKYYDFYKDNIPEGINMYVNDTQGPFDIAHLIYGDKLFTELYDDPEFVHHLLDLSTAAYIEITKVIKKTIGEELNRGYHSRIYMSSCGIRCCEDTTTLISEEQFEEFAFPYIKKALKAFGGGWVHWCGSGHQFLDRLLEEPLVKGINFGNPERYDWNELASKLVKTGTVYNGSIISQQKNESIEEYFKRVLAPLPKKGYLIFHAHPHENADWSNNDKVYELWKKVHNF
ncbi:MAG: uroporphyrinogen decarboxylase family protein [Halanaerobiales bacterium]